MKTASARKKYVWLTISLVLLANPNLHIIDVLPDTVAWFVLARLMTDAADRFPSFAHVRKQVILLGWLNLIKLPALALIAPSASSYGHGDTVALTALVFAIGDLLLAVPAVLAGFDALFYVGERSDANALLDASAPRTVSLLFVICKTCLATLPTFLQLTKKEGTVSRLSKYYTEITVGAIVIVCVFGVFWLCAALRYAKKVYTEGKFDAALRTLSAQCGDYTVRRTKRLLQSAFLLLEIGVLFLFPLSLDNLDGMSLFPDFVFAILAALACAKLSDTLPCAKRGIGAGAFYGVLSLTNSLLLATFVAEYGYAALIHTEAAQGLYRLCEAGATGEFLAYSIFLVFLFLTFRQYIPAYTGLAPESPDYRESDASYHRSLQRGNLLWFLTGELLGAAKLWSVFLRGEISVIETQFSETVVYAPKWEWFGAAVGVLSVVFLFRTIANLSLYRDELALREGFGEDY